MKSRFPQFVRSLTANTSGKWALLALAFWAPLAFAASPVVTSKLAVQAVVTQSGHETLKAVTTAAPGDVLQYDVVYTNNSDAAIGGLTANLPVPVGTSLETAGLSPDGAQASVDGNHFSAMPLMHTVTGADGKAHQMPVPLADIRAVRWNLAALAPHQDKTVQARVRVISPAAPPKGNQTASAQH